MVVNITNPALYESVSSGSGWFWISLLCLFGLFLCYVCLLLEYRGRVLAEGRLVKFVCGECGLNRVDDGVLGWIGEDGEFVDEGVF